MNMRLSKLAIRFFILVALVHGLPSISNGQENTTNDSFGKKSFSEGLIFSGTLGYNSYFGDLTEDDRKNILPFNNQSQFALGLGVHKELFGFFELGVKGLFGKVKEVSTTKIPTNNNSYIFNSNITQVGLNANINVINLIKRKTNNKFAFLLSAGYGITAYDPESTVIFPDNNEGKFPAKVTPEESGSYIEGTFSFGIGARYKFTDKWAVGVEATIYNVAADNLDSWVDNSSFNDRYSFIGASVNYILGKKKIKKSPINEDKAPVLAEEVETPVNEIVETPTKEVIETPTNEIVETPIKEVVETPTNKVVETPAREVVETPVKVVVGKEKSTSPKLTVNDFKLDIIYFDVNKNQETDALNKQISAIASKLNKHPSAKIVLAGFTDKSGSETYNQALSERRANWVRNTLVSKYKISGSRITTVGKGEHGSTRDYQPKDRRVEVIKIN